MAMAENKLTTEEYEKFWNRLDNLIEKKGTTKTALQAQLKMNSSYLFVTKSRKSIPSVAVISKLADALDTTVDYLINGTGTPIKSDDILESVVLMKFRSDSEFRKAVEILLENRAIVRIVNASAEG